MKKLTNANKFTGYTLVAGSLAEERWDFIDFDTLKKARKFIPKGHKQQFPDSSRIIKVTLEEVDKYERS